MAWIAPRPVQAAGWVKTLGHRSITKDSVAPPPAPTQPQASATPKPPPSPCSAWSSDAAILKPAPKVCRDYISSQGNAELVLDEPIMSKVPQEPALIAEFAGVQGDTATDEFTVEQPWRIDLESDSDFMMAEFRYGPMRNEKVIRLPKFTQPGKKHQVLQQPGTYYLNVRADGSWRARITLLEKEYRYDYDIAAKSHLVNPTALPLLITYSFGEGKREEIALAPGQRLPIEGNIALSDYTEPRNAEQLREDFPGLLIHQIENVSDAAVERRQSKIKQERQAKLDPRRTRSAARSELQHTAIGVHEQNQEERITSERELSEQASTKDRRWKRGWGAAGVATIIAGAGAGTALMVIGGTRLPEAKEGLRAAKEERAKMGDNPSPNIEVEIGRRSKEVSNAQNQITTGIIIAAAGVAAGTILLVISKRTPSKRRARQASFALKVQPWLAPGFMGAGAGLRF